MEDSTLTRAELEVARGGLEPNGDVPVGARLCEECGKVLPADAGGRRRYCTSRCQNVAKRRRSRERGEPANGVPITYRVTLPRDNTQPELLALVVGLVGAGLVVELTRDGWCLRVLPAAT